MMQTADALVATPAASSEARGPALVQPLRVSLAVTGALVVMGAATLMYGVAGGIVLVAALAGMVWGVPAAMEREATA